MADDIDEEPLDPKVENVRRRLARMQMISSGIMVVGLMAVFLAIVYKVMIDTDVPKPAIVSDVALPAGSRIIASALHEDTIMLTLQMADGSTQVHVYNGNGTLRTTFRPEN